MGDRVILIMNGHNNRIYLI